MFYTHVLESVATPREFYRGHTNDLKRRVGEHNAGKCPHTAKFKPWKVKFYTAFETLALAQEFEKYLKSGSGHAFAKRHLFRSENEDCRADLSTEASAKAEARPRAKAGFYCD